MCKTLCCPYNSCMQGDAGKPAFHDGCGRELVVFIGHCTMQALAEELARRLGRDRCWRVRWPSEPSSTADADDPGAASVARKDANEVLLKDGPEALQALIQDADPYPIRGLFKCDSRLSNPGAFCAFVVLINVVSLGQVHRTPNK